MKATKIFLSAAGLIIIGVGVYYVFSRPALAPDNLLDHPTPLIVEEPSDLIVVDNPITNQLVSDPLTVSGQARGNWFFEASFPLILKDANGVVVAQGIATAQGEWMTTEFVPFSSTLTFIAAPTAETGELILHKDNPSGMPEYDDKLVVPVKFDLSAPVVISPCIVTGCSSQVCSDVEVTTTCDFKPAFVCYSKAVCERQLNGECGWTETTDLKTCLDEFK